VSLSELAAAIGVSHVAITRWEAGAQPADPTHLAAYVRLFDELQRLSTSAPKHMTDDLERLGETAAFLVEVRRLAEIADPDMRAGLLRLVEAEPDDDEPDEAA
jgi:transcriptional regulator with XRE-family HTH domain